MKINLKKFEKNLVVRPLRAADWADVVTLQKRCFPGMDTSTKDQFESQLKIFPEGQIGVEYQGKLVAASGSLVLDFRSAKALLSGDGHVHQGPVRKPAQDFSRRSNRCRVPGQARRGFRQLGSRL